MCVSGFHNHNVNLKKGKSMSPCFFSLYFLFCALSSHWLFTRWAQISLATRLNQFHHCCIFQKLPDGWWPFLPPELRARVRADRGDVVLTVRQQQLHQRHAQLRAHVPRHQSLQDVVAAQELACQGHVVRWCGFVFYTKQQFSARSAAAGLFIIHSFTHFHTNSSFSGTWTCNYKRINIDLKLQSLAHFCATYIVQDI